MSVQVYILIQTEVGKASSVAKTLSSIAGVNLAEGVTGPYDVIMRAESPTMEELGRGILSKVQAVPGITRTLTCPVTSYN
jgi:DNA-binding Lrp family transcriptional regulator